MAQPDRTSFTDDLDTVVKQATRASVSLEEIETALQGRGFASMILILSIPFVQPIPLPGLSTVIGVVIMALGARLALGKAGGLPHFVKKREIEVATLRKIATAARKALSYVDKLFKPRLGFMLRAPLLNVLGISIVISGFALSLPLPPVILFSNGLPAWAIVLLCLGFLERDGLVVLLGHALAVATWIYFAFWWEAVVYAFTHIEKWLTGL